jgi:spore maturation protein CgeB
MKTSFPVWNYENSLPHPIFGNRLCRPFCLRGLQGRLSGFTSNDNLEKVLTEFRPDIFVSSLNKYNLKFLDLMLLKKYRRQGLVFFNQIRPWKSQTNQFGAAALESKPELVKLIKEGLAGDIFFHWLEQDDPAMKGFTAATGYPFHTILLAANTKKYFYDYDEKYRADISFVGSLLPSKREFVKKHLFPLVEKYDVRIYGSDWTLPNRLLGYLQKAGQYFNIEPLKNVRKLPLPPDDERKVYSSSTISLNIHEDHQRKFGSDFNERTLKIIASGGLEVCDNVKVIRRYFNEDELVMAKNTDDWFEKIDYYFRYPEKGIPIIKAGQQKVLREHTYHNRANQMISIYNKFKGSK